MFIINLTYKKSLDEADVWMEPHLAFMEKGYRDGIFLMSGRKVPRTGGIILARANSKSQLEQLLKTDPFYIKDIAAYEIIEFSTKRYHPEIQNLIEQAHE